MKKIVIIIAFAVISGAAVFAALNMDSITASTASSVEAEGGQIVAAGDLTWHTSYTEALQQAMEEDKMVLVNFTGSDWCTYCIQLDENVFSKEEFHAWAKENAVLLYLDFPQKKQLSDEQMKQNQKLAELFGIRGFPTILFLDKGGAVMARAGFGTDASQWIKDVEGQVTSYRELVQ